VQEIDRLRNNTDTALMSGLNNLDKKLTPMRGGELIPILGYTSNYKSGFMAALTENAVSQLQAANEIIVVCSWEDSVEDRGIWDLAGMSRIDTTAMDRGEISDGEWKRLLDASIKRAETPIYYIGHSDQDLRRRPRLSLPQVWQVLEHLYSYHGKQARLIALDYLQRIRPENMRRDWRVAMMETVDTAKDMAIAFNVPTLLGTQASRSVKTLAPPRMPGMEHALETSNIEQSAGKFFSLAMPIKNGIADGESFQHAGRTCICRNNLVLVDLLKQKRGEAPLSMAFEIDFKTHKMSPYRSTP
jgi:replicative DNA helicase